MKTSHQLAKELLELPDLPVVVKDGGEWHETPPVPRFVDDFFYKPGSREPAIVLEPQ